ncbi:MAG: hypothetical protein NTW61_07435 [Candidatus Melainabacteria bacterium]|nr:hypothetical protein [Candidatus Melainabacteria bacterium]
MMAYYRQKQAMQGGQVPQQVATASMGNYPANYTPEDTNSAFWTPAIATTMGAGLTAGTYFGFQGYNEARTKFGETIFKDRHNAKIATNLDPIITKIADDNKQAVEAYKTANQVASENAIETYLKREHSSGQGAKFTDEKISELKGKSNAVIIKELQQAGETPDLNTFDEYLRDERRRAMTNAGISKPELSKITPDAIENVKQQALAETLNQHGNTGLTVDTLKATDGKLDVAKVNKAKGKFNTAVLADDALNPVGKRYGMGWNGAGSKIATVLAVGATLGTGIGLWNASQTNGRNEEKLAALREQELSQTPSLPSIAQQQLIARDFADNGMRDGSVG